MGFTCHLLLFSFFSLSKPVTGDLTSLPPTVAALALPPIPTPSPHQAPASGYDRLFLLDPDAEQNPSERIGSSAPEWRYSGAIGPGGSIAALARPSPARCSASMLYMVALEATKDDMGYAALHLGASGWPSWRPRPWAASPPPSGHKSRWWSAVGEGARWRKTR